MIARRRAVLLLLLAAGCATGGGAGAGGAPAEAARTADDPGLPPASALADGPERAAYAAARAHEARGDAATGEAAHAEWAKAGAGYVAAAAAPGAQRWRAPLRLRAAELLLRSQRWDAAIAAVLADPFATVRAALDRAHAGTRLGAAERLLAEGKPGDAARALEAIAAETAAEDAATALHNAAIAWDRAGDPAQAARVRERIVTELAAAPVAPENGLSLAAYRAAAGDHLGAARGYDAYLARWPEAPGRCAAVRNGAAELDRAGRAAEAAARYLAFGRDAGCARSDPDVRRGRSSAPAPCSRRRRAPPTRTPRRCRGSRIPP